MRSQYFSSRSACSVRTYHQLLDQHSNMSIPLELSGRKDPLDWTFASGPLPRQTRQAIIKEIFQVDLIDQQFQQCDSFSAFFTDWYDEQCETAASDVSAKTHREILTILATLQVAVSAQTPRAAAIDSLCSRGEDRCKVGASVDLAARLWLSAAVGSFKHAWTPGYRIAWHDTQCLKVAIQQTLSSTKLHNETVKLPKIFNAANLERITGIQVVWTSNLADHLALKDEDTKVMLFHQASFLELHKISANSILPRALLDETMQTLGLLIPSLDKKSQTWFRKNQKRLSLDRKAGSYGPLNADARQIDCFHYWRDRLIILKQTFDESEPHTLSLWWNDDRKKVQWYTFWIAALVLLLTIIFGLTQSITGIVSAWAAIKYGKPGQR